MRFTTSKADAVQAARAVRTSGGLVALVPTMGYLHAGHLSLVEEARKRADHVAMSVFVNPLQFGAGEDLDSYPRDLERDRELAESGGVDLMFAPSAAEMYPGGEPWVAVVPERGAEVLCGASRPGHFRGVLTVVAKLFGIFSPDVAVFGQKDYQQAVLIRRMVQDLDMGVDVVTAPTLRDTDGLAMSSRNSYLTPAERERALSLSRALGAARDRFAAGERDAAVLERLLQEEAARGVQVEYASLVDPETLAPVQVAGEGTVCLVAGRVGRTRLIDNCILGS